MGIVTLAGAWMFFVVGSSRRYGTFDFDAFTSAYIVMGIIFLILAEIMIFPALYLYRFRRRTSEALDTRDTKVLTEAIRQMNLYWKFMGIMTIVAIALSLLSGFLS